MATILTQEQLVNFDTEYFNECAKWHRLAGSPVWKTLNEALDVMVNDALASLGKNVSSDPMVTHSMKIRWQQRKLMRDELVNMVTTHSTDYMEMAKQLAAAKSQQEQESEA
jgi:hypothetical protein